MKYANLLVNLSLAGDNTATIEISAEIARLNGSAVRGFVGCSVEPPQELMFSALAHSFLEADKKRVGAQMSDLEQHFRKAMAGLAHFIEWRTAYRAPTQALIEHSTAADLLITGADQGGSWLDPSRYVAVKGTVMTAACPVLIARSATSARLRHAVVAWKDTREARRAVSDALPLLRDLESVFVIQVVEDPHQISNANSAVAAVANWLRSHGVAASGSAVTSTPEPFAGLIDCADQREADILVGGAYGHSRIREWIFGGMTESLLQHQQRSLFLSH